MRRQWKAGVVGLAAIALLSACSGKSASSAPATSTTPSPSSTPTSADSGGLGGGGGEESSAPRSTILTTPRPSLTPPNGVKEVDGTCPYITNEDFRDGEGDRVGRSTILESKPVGCRFYFSYDPSVIVGEISINTFKTATQAYNAMVLSAKGHPEVQSNPNIGDGAVCFRTDLQGTQTWQCVFAKSLRVVTVRTRQPDVEHDAENLATEIAPRIT